MKDILTLLADALTSCMNTIIINGKKFETIGKNVVVSGNSVFVNGQKIVDGLTGITKIEWSGEVANVQSDCDVNCGNVQGNVNAGMNATCGDVAGDVDAGMNVKCAEVKGDVDAGMGVTIRR